MILALILACVTVALAVVAARKPALARIAWRQAKARPVQPVLVVAGLMLGGTALTASLIAMDTAKGLATRMELLRWASTDVAVTTERPFPIELADLAGGDPAVRESTDAVVPQLSLAATLGDVSTQRTEAMATLIGYDAARDAVLGEYELTDGTRIAAVAPRSIILNERAATRLAAKPGDTVTVTVAATGESVSLAVRGIAKMRGKAAWGFESLGFVQLGVAQKVAQAPGRVNLLRVVAPDDAKRAAHALDESLARVGLPFHTTTSKREGLAAAVRQTRFLRYGLVAMSAFLLIAGILLIVNLVVMLADERAQHLGMLRALGMRRTSLVLIGAIEGAVYSLAAGAAGAAAGLAFGALLARILQDAFQRFFLPGGSPLPFLYRASGDAVLVGFAGGALVSLATVTAAWRRASRLDVSAAIRGRQAPSPARARKSSGALVALRAGALAVVIAALVSGEGVAVGVTAALAALALGASFLRARLRERARISILSLAIVAWALANAGTADPSDARAFMQLFVALNVVVVFSLSLLVAANTASLERGAALLGRWSAGARQTLRPVLTYLAQRPLRTGLTVGVFGIVLSLVTAASTVFAADQPRYAENTSGFQVVATTMGPEAADLRASRDIAEWKAVRFKVYTGAVSIPHRRIPQLTMTVYEATPALRSLALTARDPALRSDADAWTRVLNGDRAIGSIGPPGEPMEIEGSNTTVVNAGTLRAGRLLLGVIVAPSRFADLPGQAGTTYLIRGRDGVEAAALVRSLEKQWFSAGLDASTARALVDRGREDLRAFFAIIEFMTRLALGIGILALGIIGLRAAVERRLMLGTLRALGYRRRTVGMALLAEAAIVTTAGTIVGAGGGLLLNRVFLGEAVAPSDMGALAGTVAVTYLLALLVAAGPALRAARIRPADAVRSTD